MGKIPNLPPDTSGLRNSAQVSVYYSQFWKQWIIRSRRKSNGGISPKRAVAIADFTAAVAAAKNVTPQELQNALAVSTNSPYTYKDRLIANAFGKTIIAQAKDGTTYRSLRIMTSVAQQELDSITNIPGSMLVRLADGWYGIDPGNPAQVLTMDEATGLPDWATPSTPAGGGFDGWYSHPAWSNTNANGGPAYNWIPIWVRAGFSVDGVVIKPLATSAGAIVAGGLYDASGGSYGAPGALVAHSNSHTGCVSGTSIILPFTSPYVNTGVDQVFWAAMYQSTAVAMAALAGDGGFHTSGAVYPFTTPAPSSTVSAVRTLAAYGTAP